MVEEVVVTVEELQARLDHYLRLAESGTPVSVGNEGRSIARTVPTDLDEAEIRARAVTTVEAGLAHWNGTRLMPREPVATLTEGKTIPEMIVEDRA